MVQVVIGWGAVSLVIFSLIPSVVPGAISIMGFMLSLGALFISLFSINEKTRKKYFNTTLFIALIGVFLVNDALRVWEPLPMPLNTKLIIYAVFITSIIGAVFIAKWFLADESK